MALAACNKNEVVPAQQENGKAIRFTSNLPTYTITKAASVLDGKTVNIFAGAPINATTLAEANDSKLTPATTLRWLKDQTDPTTFASVYPAGVATAMSFEYTVTEDLEYHGAVLAATAKDVEPEETVNFVYKHPFAMMKIAVNNNLEGSPAITGVSVENTYATADFDLAAETVSTKGELVAIDATLVPTNAEYDVVLIPQSAKPIIKVNIGGDAPKTYKFVITSDVDFAANKYYNVALTLDESTPPVVEGEEVEFGFIVADWEAAEEEIPVINVTDKWTLIGIGGDWYNDVEMTLVNDLWTATGVVYQLGDEFKLRKELDWNMNAGMKDGVACVGGDGWDGYLEANSANNIRLAAAGIYTLTFNPENYVFTATKTGNAPAPAVNPWKVVGSMNEWTYADGIEMTEDEGVWECDITYAAGDEFKFFNGASTWVGLKSGWTFFGTGEFGDNYLWTDGSAGNIVIGAEGGIAGNYHLAFTPSDLHFVITPINAEP